jgi:ABC-type glutathione transport system ATPase component
VTHDLELASQASRIVYLDAGQIIESGSHDDLIRAGGRYATLYAMQREQSRDRVVDEFDATMDEDDNDPSDSSTPGQSVSAVPARSPEGTHALIR